MYALLLRCHRIHCSCIDLSKSYPTQYRYLKYEESAVFGIGCIHLNTIPGTPFRLSLLQNVICGGSSVANKVILICVVNTGKPSHGFTTSRNCLKHFFGRGGRGVVLMIHGLCHLCCFVTLWMSVNC